MFVKDSCASHNISPASLKAFSALSLSLIASINFLPPNSVLAHIDMIGIGGSGIILSPLLFVVLIHYSCSSHFYYLIENGSIKSKSIREDSEASFPQYRCGLCRGYSWAQQESVDVFCRGFKRF